MNDVIDTDFELEAQPISDPEPTPEIWSSRAVALFKTKAADYIIPSETAAPHGLRLAFDVEANGLLDSATVVHCIVIRDLDRDDVASYGPAEIGAALEHLSRADYLTSHNALTYDTPLLHKLYGWASKPGCTVMDTLVVGRLILADVATLDDEVAASTGEKLGKLRGSHSLAAWGARLGTAKIGVDIEDWSVWTPEMQERCVRDTEITKAVWQLLQPDGYDQRAVELEHRVAAICERIRIDGAPFDADRARQLEQQWTARCDVLKAELSQQFPGVKITSRPQIGAALEARGWVPEERTEKKGLPKVTDEVLETIPAVYPEFAGLAEFHQLKKLLAALSTGEKAWLRHIGADGRIHGTIVSLGTPHGRAAHSSPNLAQVPNPKKGGKRYGGVCRSLFRSVNGWVVVSADQGALQDRGVAHYLHPHDGGAYGETFASGADSHWKSAGALGFVTTEAGRDKTDKLHTTLREWAKTFRYMFLYGGQALRAGWTIYNASRSARPLDDGKLYRKFFGNETRPSEIMLRGIGKKARQRFIDSIPGLAALKRELEGHARHGWLPGLDGRRVPVRALYTVLNYIVTSSEAIICKRWLVSVYDELCARFRYGWDGDVVLALWVHDEIVAHCRPEIADAVGEILVRHGKAAGAFYGFKVPLAVEYTVGQAWAEAPEVPPESSTEQPSVETLPPTAETVIPEAPPVEDEPPPIVPDDDPPQPQPRSRPRPNPRAAGPKPSFHQIDVDAAPAILCQLPGGLQWSQSRLKFRN
jgi:DNA polymerase I-like protein with 3'-5' exonuclease and polymerase domains